MLAVSLAFAFFATEQYLAIGVSLVLAVLSFIDDMTGLPITIRLVTHFACAAVFASQLPLPWPVILLSTVGLAASANIYNFMDGANGLAAGVAVIGFAFFAAAAQMAGDSDLALISAVIASATAGFLLFNFGRARVFLGDVGSIPIGFLAGAISLSGWIRGTWPLIFPLLVFSPFILDASTTLLRRAVTGRIVWHSHREHYYQRLIQMGWGHPRIAITYYVLTLAVGLLGLALLTAPSSIQWSGVTMVLCIAAILMRKTDALWGQWAKVNNLLR